MTPSERLNQYLTEGRLIRYRWTGTDKQGRETACLLAAMSPEVAVARAASDCPSSIMPSWFAHLTPWIDDAGSEEAWPGVIRRYAGLAARWHVLTPEAWERLDYRCRLIALNEADNHYDHGEHPDVATVAARVRTLLARAISGDRPSWEEWDDAQEAAAKAAAWAADAVAAAWAADRMITAMLDAIEGEIDAMGGK